MGEGDLRFSFYLLFSYPYLIGNKLILQIQSVLPVMVIGDGSLPFPNSNHEPFFIFSLPCPAEERE